MSPEEFRRHGHDVIDWIADYLADIDRYPVLAGVNPGDLAARLPADGPEEGEPMERILADFRETIVPALTQWNHPRFLGYFSISSSPPAILAEALAAAVNANAMLWRTSPAGTELEQVTLGWLRQWLGLPSDYFGIIFDTASTSSLHAIVCAREEAAAPASELVLYCSDQAHSSIEKAAVTAGIPRENIRKIPSDERFRMRPDALEREVQNDIVEGRRPFCVVATAGATPAASVDPVPAIADVCQRHNLWLHVDAAYAGIAAISGTHRGVLAGCDRAQSLVTNPHKWLLTPVDCSVFYTRRPEVQRRVFSLTPEYLRTAEDPRALNFMDYGLPLGRRFRAVKLWFVMRYYGRKGLAAVIERHCAAARTFASWVAEDPRFELCAPVEFSLVCFRLRGPDEPNRELLDRINASGLALLSHTVLRGRFVLRLAVGNYRTELADLERVWRFLASPSG